MDILLREVKAGTAINVAAQPLKEYLRQQDRSGAGEAAYAMLAKFTSLFEMVDRMSDEEQAALLSWVDGITPPPSSAERALLLVIPYDRSEEVLGHLQEEYQKVAEAHGQAFARGWYWWQAVTVGLEFLLLTLTRIIRPLFKL